MTNEQTKQAKPAAKQAAKPAAQQAASSDKKRSEKSGKTVKVTLTRSLIGRTEKQRATVRGLGLRRMHHSVELEDTPCVRGMINKVYPLLKVEE